MIGIWRGFLWTCCPKIRITHLSPQADNCIRENKNNTVLKWAAYTTCTNKFDLTAALFSRVGHTHGALGDLDFAQAEFDSACV